MTFPSNVRIISVPSGTNVVSSGVVGVNHNTLAQKIVSTGGTIAAAQVNHFFFILQEVELMTFFNYPLEKRLRP